MKTQTHNLSFVKYARSNYVSRGEEVSACAALFLVALILHLVPLMSTERDSKTCTVRRQLFGRVIEN